MIVTEEAIERAARVLWENSLLKPYHITDIKPSISVAEAEPDWQRFASLARRVLEAANSIEAEGDTGNAPR